MWEILLDWLPDILVALLVSLGLFTKQGRKSARWLLQNLVMGAFDSLDDVFKVVGPSLDSAVRLTIGELNKHGGPIANHFRVAVRGIAEPVLRNYHSLAKTAGKSDPEKAVDTAAEFFAIAASEGLASAGVAMAFEAMFPEKMNSFNSIAPLLARLAGFDEVTKAVVEPLLKNAFGIALELKFRSEFKPDIPNDAQASQWHAQRLISEEQLRKIFHYSGLPEEWEPAFTKSKYRPMSPMMLAAGFADAEIDEPKLHGVFKFMGLRDDDIDIAMKAIENRSIQQVRNSYISEAMTAYAAGVVDDNELDTILKEAGYGGKATDFVKRRSLIARRVTLAREVEQQVVALVTAGEMTPEQGRADLQAAGVVEWQNNLKIELATTRATVAEARRQAIFERRREVNRERAAQKAAIESFRVGQIEAAELGVILVGAGMDAAIAATVVAYEEDLLLGHQRMVYGQLLDPDQARILRESVDAIAAQLKHHELSDEAARNALKALKLEPAEIAALIARWDAESAKVKAPASGQAP